MGAGYKVVGRVTDPALTSKNIVDAALKVHRALGPGLLESAYHACLAHDLQGRRHRVECILFSWRFVLAGAEQVSPALTYECFRKISAV